MMQPPRKLPPFIGWPLLPYPIDGRLEFPTGEESVRQGIEVILRTRPGEQLMHPELGAGLDRFIHAPNTLTTRRGIQDAITSALTRWEPRILLDRVEVREIENRPTELRVEIVYRLRRTGAAQQVGLTLEIGA